MFDKDYNLKGKHATYTKFLKDTAKVFDRYMDVYMIGAVLGFLNGKQEPEDNSNKDDAEIPLSVFYKEKMKCEFIYRMIMLLDETSNLTLEQRTDRAFREDTNEQAMIKNMDLFNSYVRGGIEYLYEKFSEDCVTEDDYLNKVYEFVNRFKFDVQGESYEDLIQNIFTKM
ncbi:hypothetical protein UF75_2078 [Desulfosporosinus sp. I2]|uniref:hypothetical protein n=1 Tax=Desulfosporosinus sp. I2 TaxID=1617025 RepID=UPI0005EDA040|nr:hypothetical protein [Desulfosporosinus sp. I2]KJR47500.1 hypothetical protein UF75_2078 [Desulfosporosinus sp. I2]